MPCGFQEVGAPRFQDSRHVKGGKVVSPTHRPPLPFPYRKYSWYSFLLSGCVDPWNMSMKNSTDIIGNRTRDTPRGPKKVGLCLINIIASYCIIQFRKLTTASSSTPITPEQTRSQTATSSTYWGKNGCWLCPTNRYKQQDTLW